MTSAHAFSLAARAPQPVVLIYRNELLHPSETFVLSQARALQSYQPFWVGRKRVQGLPLPSQSWILDSGGVSGRVKRLLHKSLGFAPGMADSLKRLHPVLVHGHFGVDSVSALHLSKSLKVPLVVTYHGYDATMREEFARDYSYEYRRYLRWKPVLKNEVARFIAVSHFVRQKLIDQGFAPNKITVHYVGVDTEVFQPDTAFEREPVVLFAGRLMENKGCEYLVKAMALVQQTFAEAQLVVIGDGPERASLEELSARSLKKYTFLGLQPQTVLRHWMNRAAVFSVPSVTTASGTSEGFGLVFAEAQAMGAPVASFATGGIPEAVLHGVTGLLAPEKDVDALAANISRLLSDSFLWKQMSTAGIARVRREFDLRKQSTSLESIYADVTGSAAIPQNHFRQEDAPAKKRFLSCSNRTIRNSQGNPVHPVVSVIIPTRSRPDLVVRAVRSVLAQTFADVEVIVVVDGPDHQTCSALYALESEQVTVLALPEHVGGSEARNIGVRAARGQWIAFLDDDDEWVPTKLERQLSLTVNNTAPYLIVTSATIVQQPDAHYIWPRKAPSPPLSEYLLARGSLYQGEGVLPIITWLVSRNLFDKIEFRRGLRKHQDWDWLLRAAALPGVEIEHIAEPLAIWHLDHAQTSVSRTQDWKTSLEWIRSIRPLITPRAYSGFLATQVGAQAARQRRWSAFLPTLFEMFRRGRPRFVDVSLFFGMWFVPTNLRKSLRRRATSSTPQAVAPSPRMSSSSKNVLTVGLPVHNAMPYLKESIESLLSQSDRDFQILAIDDGSTDGSLEYLHSINDSRLRVIAQPHRKLTFTLNHLLEECDTPWLVRHDADDVASLDRIAVTRRFISEHSDAGMFYSEARYYQSGQTFGTFRTTKAPPEELRKLTEDGYLLAFCHPTVTLNVAKVFQLGGYRFDLHVEDIDLWWRMALTHDIHFMPHHTVFFRHNATSVSTSNLEQQSINTLYIQYLLLSHLKGLEPLPFEIVRGALSRLLNIPKLKFRERMRNANICASRKQYPQCAKHMLSALAASPKGFVDRVAYEFSSAKVAVSGEDPAIFENAARSLWPPEFENDDFALDDRQIAAAPKAS